MHWETKKKKNSGDSLYCNIRFIVVVWNQTHSISEVRLYLPTVKVVPAQHEEVEACRW